MDSSDGLMATVDRLAEATDAQQLEEVVGGRASAGIPARPLLGVLPLARLVPQDVHSLMDYAGGLTLAAAGLLTGTGPGRVAGLALGGAAIGASLLTDYRLSLAKLIPIEVHEVLDFVVGAGAIAAPFALGYSRHRKGTAAAHVAVGLTQLLASLFTDYRAATGVRRRLQPA